jgi:hypothetical protein
VTDDTLALHWQAFRIPKAGNTPADYEDAFAGDGARGRFAVADGVTEASFAGPWARLLARGFVAAAGKPWRGLDWLAPLRQRWAEDVDGLALSWYAEAKREQGAFATLLGLAFRPPQAGRPGTWRALAVGDCCLFRTRRGRVLKAFPVTHADDFGNEPRLLGSRASRGDCPEQGEQAGGRWRPGERFLLMSDALAQWFLRRTEQGRDPCAAIGALLAEADPEAAFAGWVEERRRGEELHNDDVTLLAIDFLHRRSKEQ